MLKKMRQCRLNFADNRYDCEAGIIGEHYATELIVTPPAIMPAEAVYRLCFEPGGLSEIILQTTDGAFSYPLPSAVTATPYCCVTLIGYVGSEQIYKSRMVRLHFSQTADGDSSIDLQQPGIVDEVNRNTAARHGHDNKPVIDLLTADDTGTLLYDGKVIGDGGSTETELFVVNVQAQSEEGEYTITSHDKTYTQIDEAYKAGKQILAVCTITSEDTVYLIPLIFATETDYTFSVFAGANFYIYVDSTDTWDISIDYLEASTIKAKLSDDASAKSSSLQYILNYMVYPAVEKAHEHSNETVLDHLSDSNGKLLYNGTEAGLKGEKGDKGEPGTPGAPGAPGSDATVTKANVVAALGYTPQAVSAQVTAGTEITLADNTEYRLTDVTTLTLTYPTGNFECWLKLSFAASGSVTVTLPTGTKYIGNAPSFANGETWEMSIKDGVVIAQKVGDGT